MLIKLLLSSVDVVSWFNDDIVDAAADRASEAARPISIAARCLFLVIKF